MVRSDLSEGQFGSFPKKILRNKEAYSRRSRRRCRYCSGSQAASPTQDDPQGSHPRAGRGQGVVSTPEGAPGAAWSQSPLHVPIAAPPSHPNKAARTGRKRELHNCNPMGPQNKTTRRPSPGRGSGPGSAHSLGFPPTHTRADLTSPETCTPTLAMAVRSHSPVTTGHRVGAAQPWRPAAQRPGCLPARPVLCPAPRGMLGRAWPVESRRSRL